MARHTGTGGSCNRFGSSFTRMMDIQTKSRFFYMSDARPASYTRIDYVMNDLNVSRPTAAKYLDQLAEAGLVTKHQSGRNNYYINDPLVALFLDVSEGA